MLFQQLLRSHAAFPERYSDWNNRLVRQNSRLLIQSHFSRNLRRPKTDVSRPVCGNCSVSDRHPTLIPAPVLRSMPGPDEDADV